MLELKFNKKLLISVTILIFLVLFVGLPFAYMLKNISGDNNYSFDDVLEYLGGDSFKSAIINSIKYTTVASVISVSLAFLLGYGIYKTNIKLKKVIYIICFTPMIIPTFSIGLGLVNLFSPNGIITNLINFDIKIYGFKGLVMGSVLYSFPVAFLILSQTFKYENKSLYEASEVLNINKTSKLLNVTLPRFKKSLILTFFSVFVMIFSDFGIPAILKGKTNTLPSELYAFILNYKFPQASAIGFSLMMPAIVYFLLMRILKESRQDKNTEEIHVSENKTRDVIYQVLFCLIMLFLFIFILSFFIIAFASDYPNDLSLSLDIFTKMSDYGIWTYAIRSVIIAIISSLVGVVITYLSGYLKEKNKNYVKIINGIDFLSTISMLVPGLVLGLGYLLLFQKTYIYDTIIIVVIVNVAHFYTSPYMMSRNALETIDDNYDKVAKVLNISEKKMFLNVIIPNTKTTIVEMFTYIFTNSMITISAVSILTVSNSDIKPIAVMISYFNEKGYYSESSAIAALIFVINIVVISLSFLVKHKLNSKKGVKDGL